MEIKDLIKSTVMSPISFSNEDFVAVQFMQKDVQQYYIIKNRYGQNDTIVSYDMAECFMKESKNINITSLSQLDEVLKLAVTKRIEQIYISMLEIK